MTEITPSTGVSLTEKEKAGIERTGSGHASSMEGDVRANRGAADYDFERQKLAEGEAAFHQLGWKRLTVVLIVTAVALGSLSLPAAFASLGMILGVIISVSMGLLAMYCSYVVGQVKVKYPHIAHYTDAGRMMFGKWGYIIMTFMFVLQLTFTTASHVLTGAIMFGNLTNNGACTVVFAVVSGILLFLLAIPPTFSEMAILGYVDFVSIIGAIGLVCLPQGGLDAARGLHCGHQHCVRIQLLTLPVQLHGRDAHSSRLSPRHLLSRHLRDLPLHHHRRPRVRLCWSRCPGPCSPLGWPHHVQGCLWCRPARHLHLWQHQHRCLRPLHPWQMVQGLGYPLRQHPHGLDHLDWCRCRHHNRRLCRCRGHSLLLAPVGHLRCHLPVRLHILLPGHHVVHVHQGGQVDAMEHHAGCAQRGGFRCGHGHSRARHLLGCQGHHNPLRDGCRWYFFRLRSTHLS
ncbi:hypothetical protein QC764_600290 [Podospora pseudoanserina]|uniref:Amino acid transporter transmembrane domain-containing protein n=1 Tax=Podospora pseudoanserina TaxID=2609844 RepID=A0ABR0HU05_9PEZI|nr:hypothetical protein QC764_600290 [Podospora pseudoanserina]